MAAEIKMRVPPESYAFNKPHRIQLGKALNEISGICYNEADSSILVVSDSKEKVYEIDFKTKKIKRLYRESRAIGQRPGRYRETGFFFILTYEQRYFGRSTG